MTPRQKIVKLIYPAIMAAGKWFGMKASIKRNSGGIHAPVALANLHIFLNNGQTMPAARFAGKKLLLVNTASDCGYTSQLGELQQLQDRFQQELVVIGFPSNDFKEQEKGSDQDIASFCAINYGVKFLLAKKSVVKKQPDQNEVFKWLTNTNQNGWNNQQPGWNFTKYLISESGVLTHVFESGVSPLDKKVTDAIQAK